MAEKFRLARELMAASPADSQRLIKNLDETEAVDLLTQIRYLSRSRNPDVDKLYYILQKIESLQANRLAQERLQNLLGVIFFSIALFLTFLMYVLWKQRSLYRSVLNLHKD